MLKNVTPSSLPLFLVWMFFLVTFAFVTSLGKTICETKYRNIHPEHSMCKPRNDTCKFGRGVEESAEQLLDLHNEIRKSIKEVVGSDYSEGRDMRDMQWDRELYLMAQRHVLQCTGRPDCPRCHQTDRFHVEQNFAVKTFNSVNNRFNGTVERFKEVIKDWARELRQYLPEAVSGLKFAGLPTNWTNIFRATTVNVGCASMDYYAETGDSFTEVYVCNYGPAILTEGEEVYKQAHPNSNGSICGLCKYQPAYGHGSNTSLRSRSLRRPRHNGVQVWNSLNNDIPVSSSRDYCDAKYQEITQDHSMCKPDAAGCTFNREYRRYMKALTRIHNEIRNSIKEYADGDHQTATNMKIMEWDNELYEIARRYVIQCYTYPDCAKCHQSGDFFVEQNFAVKILLPNDKNGSEKRFTNVVKEWAMEMQQYTSEDVKNLPRKVLESNNKHWTNIFRATTWKIGCASTSFNTLENQKKVTKEVYICNYGPAQLTAGEVLYEFGPSCSNCGDGYRCDDKYVNLCRRDVRKSEAVTIQQPEITVTSISKNANEIVTEKNMETLSTKAASEIENVVADEVIKTIVPLTTITGCEDGSILEEIMSSLIPILPTPKLFVTITTIPGCEDGSISEEIMISLSSSSSTAEPPVTLSVTVAGCEDGFLSEEIMSSLIPILPTPKPSMTITTIPGCEDGSISEEIMIFSSSSSSAAEPPVTLSATVTTVAGYEDGSLSDEIMSSLIPILPTPKPSVVLPMTITTVSGSENGSLSEETMSSPGFISSTTEASTLLPVTVTTIPGYEDGSISANILSNHTTSTVIVPAITANTYSGFKDVTVSEELVITPNSAMKIEPTSLSIPTVTNEHKMVENVISTTASTEKVTNETLLNTIINQMTGMTVTAAETVISEKSTSVSSTISSNAELASITEKTFQEHVETPAMTSQYQAVSATKQSTDVTFATKLATNNTVISTATTGTEIASEKQSAYTLTTNATPAVTVAYTSSTQESQSNFEAEQISMSSGNSIIELTTAKSSYPQEINNEVTTPGKKQTENSYVSVISTTESEIPLRQTSEEIAINTITAHESSAQEETMKQTISFQATSSLSSTTSITEETISPSVTSLPTINKTSNTPSDHLRRKSSTINITLISESVTDSSGVHNTEHYSETTAAPTDNELYTNSTSSIAESQVNHVSETNKDHVYTISSVGSSAQYTTSNTIPISIESTTVVSPTNKPNKVYPNNDIIWNCTLRFFHDEACKTEQQCHKAWRMSSDGKQPYMEIDVPENIRTGLLFLHPIYIERPSCFTFDFTKEALNMWSLVTSSLYGIVVRTDSNENAMLELDDDVSDWSTVAIDIPWRGVFVQVGIAAKSYSGVGEQHIQIKELVIHRVPCSAL